MKQDRLSDLGLNLFTVFPRRNTSRNIWNIGAEIVLAFFYDDRVALHEFHLYQSPRLNCDTNLTICFVSYMDLAREQGCHASAMGSYGCGHIYGLLVGVEKEALAMMDNPRTCFSQSS